MQQANDAGEKAADSKALKSFFGNIGVGIGMGAVAGGVYGGEAGAAVGLAEVHMRIRDRASGDASWGEIKL